jgi:preprotein translocase subunit YajC
MIIMKQVWIIAQAGGENGPSEVTGEPLGTETQTQSVTQMSSDPNQGTTPPPKSPGAMIWVFYALLIVMMYMIMFRGPKKKQQQHTRMIKGLEKNDRVRTIGGIIGTVIDVKDDEILLKVDEANNTKIRVATSAIGKNLTKESGS